MEGIAAARARIESIRTRFDGLTPRRDFRAVLAGHTAATEPESAHLPEPAARTEPVATLPVATLPVAPVPAAPEPTPERHLRLTPTAAPAGTATAAAAATPAAQPAPAPARSGLRAAATVTLGTMTGTGPAVASLPPPPDGIATRAELDAYLDRHGVEDRNGRLGGADLVVVTGAWKGTARLLAPAAAAWEAMRAAAAADGIDLRAVDTYRSWESQSRAYAAFRRGDKTANVLPPGRSEHGHGLAIDVTNGSIVGPGDPEWEWLRANARRYGWYPIANESWHWEFRGV